MYRHMHGCDVVVHVRLQFNGGGGHGLHIIIMLPWQLVGSRTFAPWITLFM